MALKTLQGIDLRKHTDIVFERENLLDAYPVDRLRIGQNDANHSAIPAFVVIRRFNTHIISGGKVQSSDALPRSYTLRETS